MELVLLQRERDCVEYGNLRDNEGQYEKALAAYDSALRIDPEDADAWYNKGETLNKMGRHAEAAKCIATAIDLYCG